MEKDPLPVWNMRLLDVEIALDYIDLTATSLGLVTCWVASFDEFAVKKVLSVPEEIRVISAIAIRYPSTPSPKPRPRKALGKLVCYEKYK